MLAWNYANIWESIAAAQPNQPAVVQGDEVWSASQLDAHADGLASLFLSAGLMQQSKVAVYLYNCPQFIASYLGAFKAGLAAVNTNFRYGPSELFYLFDNADAEAIVFHASFAPQVESIRSRLSKVKLWLAVGDGAPSWAERYDQRVSDRPSARGVQAPWGRSGDDLLLLYTGGTTGAPKGVMWRQEDLIGAGNFGANALLNVPAMTSPEEAGRRALALERPISMVPCPLMHGTGLLGAFSSLGGGGTIVLLDGTGFDAEQLWTQVERWHATRIAIVGQPFAAPMLEALERHPKRWDLGSVRAIMSSGAMWSQENKRALHRHLPAVVLADGFSSSEAMSMGYSLSGAGSESATAHFHVGERCAVFNDAGERVKPGSGERGRVAVSGHIPLGYYKDPIKSAQTFPTLEGRRWSMPGDYAELNLDGTLTLIGRGSQCINTGGEKVYPEEVEEALKRHPSVRDVAVVGIPDERYGERICAIVQLKAAVEPAGEGVLIAHTKTQLAAYKAPRHVFFVDEVYRAPNGKLDYPASKQLASERYQVLSK
jgi:acyl-CoA synthetase (AMP-forming)/AMP-acid ligase II